MGEAKLYREGETTLSPLHTHLANVRRKLLLTSSRPYQEWRAVGWCQMQFY